jgi:RHS repeat-associated protein
VNGDSYQFFVNLPFGETLAEQQATGAYSNVYKFTGKELDAETGLYYLGARYYSPVDGIFLSVDPLAGSFPSWSPYVYTLNNPVRLTDPTGMAPEDEDWIPDGQGNLIAERSDNAQTLANYQGTSYQNALQILKNNGYTTSKRGGYEVLNLKEGDVVDVTPYDWQGQRTAPHSSHISYPSYYSAQQLGIAGSVGSPMGFLFDVGVAWDEKGNVRPYGTLGHFYGADLSLGLEYGVHQSEYPNFSVFDLNGTSDMIGLGYEFVDFGWGGNVTGSYNAVNFGVPNNPTYNSMTIGLSLGMPISYKRSIEETKVFWSPPPK